jgi:hypothetical protein
VSNLLPMKYYQDEIMPCKSKLIAIPLNMYSDLEDFGHATVIIIDRTGEIKNTDKKNFISKQIDKIKNRKEHIIIEYFDSSHSSLSFMHNIEDEIEKLITEMFGDRYTHEFISQTEVCPYNIQGRLSRTKYDGTCTQFQLWYAFKRLLEPEKPRDQVIGEMFTYLDNGVDGMIALIKTFQEAVKFYFFENDGIISGVVNGRNFTRMFEKDLILTKMKDDLDFIKVVKSVRRYKIDINIQPDSTKNTFLHQAVLNKSKNQVDLLLDHGADVNIQNAEGDTPMHLATIAGLQEICHMILINGYSVNIKNADGETALHNAALVGLVKICSLLLREGADVNSQDSYLSTPLHTAVNRGYIDIAEILLNRGADINLKNSVGETPLSIAQKRNRPGWVELLTKEKDKFSMYGGNRKTQKLRKSLRRRF